MGRRRFSVLGLIRSILVAKQSSRAADSNGSNSASGNLPTSDDPLLTLTEVAEIFSVHRSTVQRWVAARALPCTRTPGGAPKVRKSHVAAIVGIASSTA
jgi:excisionase family DNA binding protein